MDPFSRCSSVRDQLCMNFPTLLIPISFLTFYAKEGWDIKKLLYSQQQRFRLSAKSNSVLIVLTLWSCIHIFYNSTKMLEPSDVYLNGYKWIIKTSNFFFSKIFVGNCTKEKNQILLRKRT